MPIEFVYFLVLVVAVILAILFTLGFILIRNKKYERFIKENSKAIDNINKLNQKYIFKVYKPEIPLFYRFDNKKNWYNTETITYLSREIRHNLEPWVNQRALIEFNREQLLKYNKEVQEGFVPIEESVCVNAKKNYKKCLKTEKTLYSSSIQKPSTDVRIKVDLQYVSPKGQVNVHHVDVFSYVELVRILDSVSVIRVSKETYEKLAKVERTMLSDSMRYEVMKRDGFRCVLCGMSSKDGAILHVDHIIPIAKGGRTEMSNLQTLCEKCNIGKSDKLDEEPEETKKQESNLCPWCSGKLILRKGKDGSSFYGCSNYPKCRFTKKA